MSEVSKYQKQGSQASNYVPEVADNLAENTASLTVELNKKAPNSEVTAIRQELEEVKKNLLLLAILP